MADEPTENRLEIRSPKREPGRAPVTFGGELEITLNGKRLDYWQVVSLDLRHNEFVTANIEIAVGELVVDAAALLILTAAAQRATVEG